MNMYKYRQLVTVSIFGLSTFFPVAHAQANPSIDPYTGKPYASLNFHETIRVFRNEFPHKPLFTWHNHYAERWLIRLVQLYSELQDPQANEAALDFLRYLADDPTFKVYLINALTAALIGEHWITEEGEILHIDELKASPQLSADAVTLCTKLMPRFTYEDLQELYKRLHKDTNTLQNENSCFAKGLLLANTPDVMDSFVSPFFSCSFPGDVGKPMVQCLTGRRIFMELDPKLRRKIPAPADYFLWQYLEETFQGNKLLNYSNGIAQYGPASSPLNPDDLSTLTEDIFSDPDPIFPPNSGFEIDLHRSEFTIIIGRQVLRSEEILQEIVNTPRTTTLENEFKKRTRRKVLDAIMTLAIEHKLYPTEVLKNFLSTYVGQAASSSSDFLFMHIINDDMTSPEAKAQYFPLFHPGLMDHPPVVITIHSDGTCEVRHDVFRDTLYSILPVRVLGIFNAIVHIPCAIMMRLTYGKSLQDERPHALEEQCFCQGFFLDIFNRNGR
jgi:hypothetical protein